MNRNFIKDPGERTVKEVSRRGEGKKIKLKTSSMTATQAGRALFLTNLLIGVFVLGVLGAACYYGVSLYLER